MFESVFQSFTESADPSHGKARAAALRKELEKRGLTGFIIPRADEHQNEYVPANAERLAWLTGFTGSAGLAVVLADRAAIFVDGRYTLQVCDQVDAKVFTPIDSGALSPAEWLEKNLRADSVLGYDPWLTTPASVARYEKAAHKVGGDEGVKAIGRMRQRKRGAFGEFRNGALKFFHREIFRTGRLSALGGFFAQEAPVASA